MKMKLIFVSALCFLLSSCASYTAVESTDWSKLGESSAMRGELLMSEQAFNDQYREDDASFTLFESGYKKGLTSFCEIDNAFKYGSKGGNYSGQCDHFPRGAEFKYEWKKAFQQFMFPEGPK